MKGDRRDVVKLIAGILILLTIPVVVAIVCLWDPPTFIVDVKAFSRAVQASEILRKEVPGFYERGASSETSWMDINRGLSSLHLNVRCGVSGWGGLKELGRLRDVYARIVSEEMARYGFEADLVESGGEGQGRAIASFGGLEQASDETFIDERTENAVFLFRHPQRKSKSIVRICLRGNERHGVPLNCDVEIILHEIITGASERPALYR